MVRFAHGKHELRNIHRNSNQQTTNIYTNDYSNIYNVNASYLLNFKHYSNLKYNSNNLLTHKQNDEIDVGALIKLLLQ